MGWTAGIQVCVEVVGFLCTPSCLEWPCRPSDSLFGRCLRK